MGTKELPEQLRQLHLPGFVGAYAGHASNRGAGELDV